MYIWLFSIINYDIFLIYDFFINYIHQCNQTLNIILSIFYFVLLILLYVQDYNSK